MSHRFLPPSLVLTLAAIAACTDAAPVTVTAEPTAREWQCISVCYKELPCHNLCKLTFDEPGFQVVPGPFTCDSLRPINVCGDGCCDAGETFLEDGYCRADCKIERLEVIDREGLGRAHIIDGDLVLGTVEARFVSVAPVCEK
jgi:hypothetical protein